MTAVDGGTIVNGKRSGTSNRKLRPSEIDFEEILRLFTNRHTKRLYSRQAAALSKIVRTCTEGLRLLYLPPIREIIALVLQALLPNTPAKSGDSTPQDAVSKTAASVFLEPFCELIILHGQPFDLEKDYDEFDHAESLSATIKMLADIMRADIPALTITVAQAISNFARWNKPKNFPSQASPSHALMQGEKTPGSRGKSKSKASSDVSRFDFAPQPTEMQAEVEEQSKPSSPYTFPCPPSSSALRYESTGFDLGLGVSSFVGCPPTVLRFYIIAHSEAIATVLKTLEKSVGTLDVTLALIKLLRDLSYNPACAKQLASGNMFNLVPALLDGDARNPVVDAAVEVIWNILELDQSSRASFGTELNVQSLSNTLEQQFAKCYRTQDKELRNEVLVILLLVSKIESNRKHLARTPCLDLLLRHATFLELADHQGAAPQGTPVQTFTQTTDAVDLEMKLLLWTIITNCATEQFSHARASKANFLNVLLMYIDDSIYQSYPSMTRWPFTQMLQLQEHALHCLIKIAPTMPQQFRTESGLARLVHFAAEVVQNPNNLVEKQLARHRTFKLQCLALRALLRVSWLIDFHTDDCPSVIISDLIAIFRAPQTDLMPLLLSVSVLSLIIRENDANRRVFRKEGGLQVITQFLSDLPALTKAGAQCPRLIPAVVDCIWSAVRQNRRNELFFVSLDGVDHLLNLLIIAGNAGLPKETTIKLGRATQGANGVTIPSAAGSLTQTEYWKVIKHIVGCLADLLENPKALPFFHEWRCPTALGNPYASSTGKRHSSKTNNNALGVLLAVWKKEEARAASENGQDLPPTDKGSFTDIKGTIHAALSRVGFQKFDYASPKEAVTLKAVETYITARQGEVLTALRQSLIEEEGVTPVQKDAESLNHMLEKCSQAQDEMKRSQQSSMSKVHQGQAQMLQDYYQKIQNRQVQHAPITKGSTAGFTMRKRLAAKEMKEDMLKNSLDVEATLRRTGSTPGIGDEDSGDGGLRTTQLAPLEEQALLRDLHLQGL